MKKYFFLLSLSFIVMAVSFSQEARTKIREIGLFTSDLNSFGIRYKSGTANGLLRLTAVALSAGKSTDDFNTSTNSRINVGFGLNVGAEIPVKLSEQFSFNYGGEFQGLYSYNLSKSTGIADSKTNYYRYGIGFVAGFSYILKSNLVISAELVPSFAYNYQKTSTTKNKSYGFSLNNYGAGISIGYRF